MIRIIRFCSAFMACVLNLAVLSSVVFGLCFLRCIAKFLPMISFLGVFLTSMIDALIQLHSVNLRYILTYGCGVSFNHYFLSQLHQDKSYIMVINHRSHTDILVILAVFYDKIPDVKFFLKRSLFYVPFLGQFCYLMNYIFVQKIAPKVARKDPSTVHRQRVMIQKQCKTLMQSPVTLAVFAEGTRFCQERKAKHAAIRFSNLLSPQPAGLALAIEACSSSVHELLDVTLVYDVGFVSVWLLLSGQVSTIEVHAQTYDVTKLQLAGDYVKDRQFRKRFSEWIKRLWLKKDALLTTALSRLRSRQVLSSVR